MRRLFQKKNFRFIEPLFFILIKSREIKLSIKIKLVLEEAGIDTRILGISELKSKRSQLLSDLWWLQSAIISRRDITRADKNLLET